MPLRLLVAHSPAERDAARAVESRVFLQAFGNTPEVMEQEYGPYQERSRFVTVIDEEGGSALGVARMIVPDATAPVKTLLDVAGEPWHLDVADSLGTAGLFSRLVWDVASLAVDRRFRSGAAGAEVIGALCHGVHQYSLNCGFEGLVTILDDRILRVVRAMGMPWTPMAGATSQYYLGSPASTPCIMVMSAVADSIRTRRPDLAPAVIDGIFRSIALTPADLLPGRGGALHQVAPPDQPDRPPVERDTSGVEATDSSPAGDSGQPADSEHVAAGVAGGGPVHHTDRARYGPVVRRDIGRVGGGAHSPREPAGGDDADR